MKAKFFNRFKKKEKDAKTPKSKKKKIIFTLVFIIMAFSTPFIIWGSLQLALGTHMPITVVASGSMEPNLYEGDLVFLKGKDPEDIKNGTEFDLLGDIIVFNTNGVWVTSVRYPVIHRVIDKRNNSGTWEFWTKGDNNPGEDGYWVPEEKIIGVVCGVIPKIGWIKLWFERSSGLMILVFIALLILIISIIWDVIKDKDEEKEEDGIKVKHDTKNQLENDNFEGIAK
ncbi:MAG: signal peptidase I [Candidatus Lokiarchaeota archaeon]|nr:signal peptidase I [Candidatus Lokiarchaeota archaeon]